MSGVSVRCSLLDVSAVRLGLGLASAEAVSALIGFVQPLSNTTSKSTHNASSENVNIARLICVIMRINSETELRRTRLAVREYNRLWHYGPSTNAPQVDGQIICGKL